MSATPHNNLPGMTEALAARHRIDRGLTWVREHRKRNELEAGERRLVRIATSEYLPALVTISKIDRRALLQHRSDTKRRLNRGLHVTGQRADDRWVQLLAEFEVLTDALHLGRPGSPLPAILDRIDLAVRPERYDIRTRTEATR